MRGGGRPPPMLSVGLGAGRVGAVRAGMPGARRWGTLLAEGLLDDGATCWGRSIVGPPRCGPPLYTHHSIYTSHSVKYINTYKPTVQQTANHNTALNETKYSIT